MLHLGSRIRGHGLHDPYAAQGFGACLAIIREIEPRLLPALCPALLYYSPGSAGARLAISVAA